MGPPGGARYLGAHVPRGPSKQTAAPDLANRASPATGVLKVEVLHVVHQKEGGFFILKTAVIKGGDSTPSGSFLTILGKFEHKARAGHPP